MLLLLTLLFFLLSFEDREAANPVEDGLLSATPVRMLRASGDVIPYPADLPTLPESVIESLDETALGEEDPNEIGGAELVCFALFDFAMPLASDRSYGPIRRRSTRSTASTSLALRC